MGPGLVYPSKWGQQCALAQVQEVPALQMAFGPDSA